MHSIVANNFHSQVCKSWTKGVSNVKLYVTNKATHMATTTNGAQLVPSIGGQQNLLEYSACVCVPGLAWPAHTCLIQSRSHAACWYCMAFCCCCCCYVFALRALVMHLLWYGIRSIHRLHIAMINDEEHGRCSSYGMGKRMHMFDLHTHIRFALLPCCHAAMRPCKMVVVNWNDLVHRYCRYLIDILKCSSFTAAPTPPTLSSPTSKWIIVPSIVNLKQLCTIYGYKQWTGLFFKH